MPIDQYCTCTVLVERGPDRPVGGCIRALSYTIWSISEIPDHVVQWLASNSIVVGPGCQGQRFSIAARGRGNHQDHLHLTHWVQVDWTIDSGD
jgi:hypothetical protein